MDNVTTEKLNQILKSTDSLESFLSQSKGMQMDMSLSDYFSYLFETKQVKKSDIIRKSLLDQNYAYQLFNGTKQNPAKDILDRLAFAFSLSVKETQLSYTLATHKSSISKIDGIPFCCMGWKIICL